MFEQMVIKLQNGSIPKKDDLSSRFEFALVKKLGVIRTPYQFWPNDPKINPLTKHLLWATILLNDVENYRIVEAIISSELDKKQKAAGLPYSLKDLRAKVKQIRMTYIREFVEVGPDETFNNELQKMARELVPF